METALKKLKRMIKSEPAVLSETDEKSEIRAFFKLLVSMAVHLLVFILYFLVIAPKFQIKEVTWLVAFAGSILFSAIGLGLTANIKEKIMFGTGILYSVFCIVSALVFLICGFFE